MCFSATASFALGSVLIPTGIWCVRKAWRGDRRYLPLAVFPLAFGIHQAIEGIVWLGINAQDPVLTCQAATGYVFFSHGFWLFWVPFTVWMLEHRPRLRKLWRALTLLGLAFGSYLVVPQLLNPASTVVRFEQRSLDYVLKLLFYHPLLVEAGKILYVFIILIPLLFTSTPVVKRLGWLILGSLIVTSQLFPYGFISVWCFFAAIVSLYVGYLFFNGVETVTKVPQMREL